MMDQRERRRAERHAERGAVFIEITTGDEDQGSQEKILVSNTLEVSTSGLRVELDQPLEPSAILQIAVKLGRLDASMYLVAEVRWCHPAGSGSGYQAGFALMESEGTDLETWRALVQAINWT